MSALIDPKGEWVERVLGIKLGGPSADAGGAAGEIAERFRAARGAVEAAGSTVEGQIMALAKRLQGSGDEDLRAIAGDSLISVTKEFRSRIAAALTEFGDGNTDKLRKNGPKAAAFIDKLLEQIEGDERVAACDANPFGVKVAISATLGHALEQMADVLREAGKLAP